LKTASVYVEKTFLDSYSASKPGDSTRGGVRALLTNPRWLLFLMAAFAGGLAISSNINYFFSYLKELGINESLMGLSLTVGTLPEILVFFFGHRLIQRIQPYRLFMLAVVAIGVRLVLLAGAGNPILILGLQLLNGLAFPAMWLAGVAYADAAAPVGLSATAQGLFGAMVFGFGAAVGGLLGGPLLESLGGRGLYLVFGVVVLVIVAAAAWLHGRTPAEPTTAPDALKLRAPEP
jgi:PPP family 3-phenylpropionic acid transporter